MKLPLSLSVLLLTVALSSSAQQKTVEFGVRAGLTVSSLTRSLDHDIIVDQSGGYTLGYSAGGFVNLNSNKWTLQPSAIFHAMSVRTNEEIVTGDIVDRKYGAWKLYYAQLPVNIIRNFKMEDGTTFYLGGGAYIASAISGKFTPEIIGMAPGANKQEVIDYYTMDARFDNERRSNFKRIDYGLNLVTGFNLKSGLLLNAGGSYGLANAQGKYNSLYKSAHITSFNLSLGYKF